LQNVQILDVPISNPTAKEDQEEQVEKRHRVPTDLKVPGLMLEKAEDKHPSIYKNDP
jgi:hypothetical protein